MKILCAGVIIILSCTVTWADELNDLPDLACAQASSALERAQIGCPEASRAPVAPRADLVPLDRVEDD
jgi:hypothetical protein